MNIFKMRLINTAIFLIIGLLLGVLLKSPSHSYRRASGRELMPGASRRPDAQSIHSGRETSSVSEEEPDEPGLEIFASPFTEERGGTGAELYEDGGNPEVSGGSSEERGQRGGKESFFRNPERYVNSELEFKLELLNLEKKAGKWRFYMGYTIRDKNAGYIDLDADEFPGDSTSLSVGSFYKVRFKCLKGDFSTGNSLISIVPAAGAASSPEEE